MPFSDATMGCSIPKEGMYCVFKFLDDIMTNLSWQNTSLCLQWEKSSMKRPRTLRLQFGLLRLAEGTTVLLSSNAGHFSIFWKGNKLWYKMSDVLAP